MGFFAFPLPVIRTQLADPKGAMDGLIGLAGGSPKRDRPIRLGHLEKARMPRFLGVSRKMLLALLPSFLLIAAAPPRVGAG